MAHPEVECPSLENIRIFLSLPLFLVPLAYNILAEQLLKSVQLSASCLCRVLRSLKMYIYFTTQRLQILRIHYKIIKYFPAISQRGSEFAIKNNWTSLTKKIGS